MFKGRMAVILILVVLLETSCKGTTQNLYQTTQEPSMKTAYIGTYTKKEGHVNGQAEGIYTMHVNTESGDLNKGKTVTKITNPSFVKTSKDGKFLYAVSELGPQDGDAGFIYSFKINEDYTLEEISKLSTEGFAPCYIEEDPAGNYIYVANYLGGVVVMYHKQEDGSLKKKQHIILENADKSHPHSVSISENNKHVYIADLGLDRIWIFDLNEDNGFLIPNKTPFIRLTDGAGPRHIALSPDGNFAYSINELNSTISIFKKLRMGELILLGEISTLPENYFGKNSPADIHIHPSGKFLYASNRGHNSITSFKIDKDSGKLNLLGFTETRGEFPRNFTISENGKHLYVANQNTNNISGFTIDLKNGTLKYADKKLEMKTPVCIEFLN